MNELIKKKIDITVLVTSLHQRDIAIETVNYYSEICSEVIFVDEQQPYLAETDIHKLRKKNINYITYKDSDHKRSIKSVYQKRLIAAKNSNKKYVVHSNHDERYTYHGLLACISELENNKNLIFCAGQAVAVRKVKKKIYYTRSYKKLSEYKNINEVKLRLYHHAELYSPMAHYSVWRKEDFIDTLEKTIFVHDTVASSGILDEVIFEFSADLAGNSKTVNELYWVRNRINPPGPKHNRDKGHYSIKIIEDKLNILFSNLNDIKVDVLINSLHKNTPAVQNKSFIDKKIWLIRLIIRKFIFLIYKEKKKSRFENIQSLLNDSNIKYDINDLKYLLNSMFLHKKFIKV